MVWACIFVSHNHIDPTDNETKESIVEIICFSLKWQAKEKMKVDEEQFAAGESQTHNLPIMHVAVQTATAAAVSTSTFLGIYVWVQDLTQGVLASATLLTRNWKQS